MISSRFSCSKKLEGCFLFLLISYDGIVDHSEQPKAVVVDGVVKDSVKGLVSVVGPTSLEVLIISLAESVSKLQAISKIRALIGNANERTEVVVDASQFNLARLKEY